MKSKQMEDIVISGISGRYPDSNCIDEFSDNLYNKVNMITDDERRYPKVFNGCPMSSSKVKNPELFDADFFGVSEYEANHMDAQIRAMLETTFEAICDSGTLPEALSGTNTGVFVGQYMDEGLVAYRDFSQLPAYKNFMSQTIANKLNFVGPTFSADAACASSLVALAEAFIAIRTGRCDRAVVIGVNISFNPGIQYNFFKLNMISPDRKCMCLDERANGYAKGEACVTIVVERQSCAKRIYANLVNVKSNNDGYKEEGITFPNWRRQKTVIDSTYEECGLDPKTVDYVEAHCTGTKAGDPVEMKAIYHSMIKGRERERPLLIGALKSNIGHTEGASGLCAITKAILAFENEVIPANLHFERPNPNIESLIKGYLKPINENTIFKGDLIGVNNFGFGGSNTHVILKSPKIRAQSDNTSITHLSYPRLVLMCGRNQQSVQHFFSKLFEKPQKITKDLLHLINNLSKANPFKTNNGCQPLTHRGFALITQNSDSTLNYSETEIRKVSENVKQICFVFTGIGSQWKSMSKQIMNFEVISNSIKNSSLILKNKNIDLLKILEESELKECALHSMVSLTAIQIGLTDLLRELDVSPNYIIGYSSGEIVSAYADGAITGEQAMLIAYHCGIFVEQVAQLKELNKKFGKLNKKDLNKFFDEYYEEVVNNREMRTKIETLSKELDSILKTQTIKTNKWIINKKRENSEYISSQYFIDCLLFPMLSANKFNYLPNTTVVVDISADCLLEKEFKKFGDKYSYINLMKRNTNNSEVLLKSFGKLYSEGFNLKIEKLYPAVTEPVSTGTRILSPFIKWDHSKQYRLIKYPDFFNFFNSKEDQSFTIDLMDPRDLYIKDHCIDGKVLVPATAYLLFAWKTLAFIKRVPFESFAVEFTNVKILRATPIPTTGKVMLSVEFDELTGRFDIIDSRTIVVSGHIAEIQANQLKFKPIFDEIQAIDEKNRKNQSNSKQIVFNSKDIYKTLRLRGYNYGPNFRCISESHKICDKYVSADIEWNDNWVTFSDCILQTSILGMKTKQLLVPVGIDLIRCDPKALFEANKNQFQAIFDPDLSITVTDGLEIRGIKASPLQRNINSTKPALSTFEFSPFYKKFIYENEESFLVYKRICDELTQKLIQNQKAFSLTGFETKIIDKIPEESKILYRILIDLNESQSNELLNNLDNDLMYGCFEDKNFFRSQMNLILENRSQLKYNKTFKITEINDSSILMYSPVMAILQNFFNTEYSLIESSLSIEKDNCPQIQRYILNDSIIGPEIDSSDLIIFKDQSLCQKEFNYEFKSLFSSFWQKLNSNGFLLVLLKDKQSFAENFIKTQFKLKSYDLRQDLVVSEAIKHGFLLVSDIKDCFSNHSLLFRKIDQKMKVEKQIFIRFTNEYKDWFQELRHKLKQIGDKPEDINIWLITNGYNEGLLGFIRCLKKETNGHRIKALQVFNDNKNCNILDDLSDANIELSEIIKRNLVINVIKDGTVGHYSFNQMEIRPKLVETQHCFLNLRNRGDLSTFEWFESQHKYWPNVRQEDKRLVHIYYSALNFKDIMLATGRLQTESPSGDTECLIGFEFSGRDENMNRVMGMVSSRALATTCIVSENDFLWPIPEQWSMEEAATVPCVYATAYYALIIRGKLKPNEKVLIHSGSGGVGQAAIRICLSYNCQLFITVGTDSKRQFLKNLFPMLSDINFSSSRDLSFKTNILKQTNGFGVDLVLNSLSDDKLFASLECLANNGRFLEIGKYDLSKDTILNISELLKNKTFHSIQVDNLFVVNDKTSKKMVKDREKIWQVMKDGIKSGVVVPLNRTVYEHNNCEKAFRFMASGKHIGKVLVKIRDEENSNQTFLFEPMVMSAIPRTVFYPNKSYIITGGLGGMGLEIIEWMIEREAKKFIITSRSGPKDDYQFSKLNYFRSIGVECRVWTQDITDLNATRNLLTAAQKMGPICGIFHLSLVMSDALFEDQTIQSFDKVFDSKSKPFMNLDSVSRQLCSQLDYFVVFSSVVSSYGNTGQSNYGFTNCVMENICEQRRADGLPALAIEWGPIGDVGYVTKYITTEDFVMHVFRSQRMFSCLQTLDRFLQSEDIICCSSVFNDFNRKTESFGERKTLLEKVSHILGHKEFEKIESKTSLSELGMDSLMSVEIKQVIERDFELVLSTQEIQNLTIDGIRQLESKKGNSIQTKNSSDIKTIGDKVLNESIFQIPNKEITLLNDKKVGKKLFYLPPTDGTFELFKPIARKMDRPVIGLNWTEDCLQLKTVKETAFHFLHLIQKTFPELDFEFDLIGYSYGVFVAIEMSLILQNKYNKRPELISLDMCPIQAKSDYQLSTESTQEILGGDQDLNIIFSFLMDKIQIEIQDFVKILANNPKNKRIERISEYFLEKSGKKFELNEVMFAIESHLLKMNQTFGYSLDLNNKLKGNVLLLRANEHLIKSELHFIAPDYGFNEMICGKCTVFVLEGNHIRFLANNQDQIALHINDYLNNN